jgi:hypothetical protein
MGAALASALASALQSPERRLTMIYNLEKLSDTALTRATKRGNLIFYIAFAAAARAKLNNPVLKFDNSCITHLRARLSSPIPLSSFHPDDVEWLRAAGLINEEKNGSLCAASYWDMFCYPRCMQPSGHPTGITRVSDIGRYIKMCGFTHLNN